MKTEALALRIDTYLNKLIDMYIQPGTMIDKMKNATLKYWVRQNISRIIPVLRQFADKDDNIDIDGLMNIYENTVFEDGQLRLNIHRLIPQEYDWAKQMLPDKIIIISREEITDALKGSR